MRALTLDDLLPLEEFASRRREFFDAHLRYLDRYRRVRVGPLLTLVFENRQTLWFRVQDVLRVARLGACQGAEEELALYNRLLPGRDRLQAALLVTVTDESRAADELSVWQALQGRDLCLHLGPVRYPADLLTCRPEDRCIGASHWVQFGLDEQGRRRLADNRVPAHFSIALPTYAHESALLSEDVRGSLAEDLH
jgi:hypothetical protein